MTSRRRPTSKFCQAVDVVRRSMIDLDCALFNGDVFEKIERSTATYTFSSSAKDFLMTLLENSEIADNIATYVFGIAKLLSDPACRIIKPITIDYDYIEVEPKGFFFNIPKKIFIRNPTDLKGSPRAFVIYKYTGKVPYPKPFVEGNVINILLSFNCIKYILDQFLYHQFKKTTL